MENSGAEKDYTNLTDVWKTVVLKKTTRTKGYDSDPEKDTRGIDLDARGQLVTIPAQTRDELEYKRGKRAGVGGVLRQYCPPIDERSLRSSVVLSYPSSNQSEEVTHDARVYNYYLGFCLL